MFKFFTKKETKKNKEATTTATETMVNTDHPEIAICDEAILIYSLDMLKNLDHVYVPKTCYNMIIKVANGKYTDFRKDDYNDQLSAKYKAIKALEYIKSSEGWCTVIPNLDRTDTFVYIDDFKPTFKTRIVVSLACLYYESGYNVCIYTRTKEIRDCASLQPNIKVKYLNESIIEEE